jgi:hypothetical protein
MFGTCAGDDEIQMIQFQMFEIMIVTGEVGLHARARENGLPRMDWNQE